MSEETKNPETEKTELAELELDSVAGGKSYLESHSNNAALSTPAPTPAPKQPTKAGGGS